MKKLIVSMSMLLILLSPSLAFAEYNLWLTCETSNFIQIELGKNKLDYEKFINTYPNEKECKDVMKLIENTCNDLKKTSETIKLQCSEGYIQASNGKSDIVYKYQCKEDN
jgi:hypothetical protein